MPRTLQYQALTQPIPPQADAGTSTPSVLWFQPLSEPIWQQRAGAYSEITRAIDTTGGTSPSTDPPISWLQPLSEPIRGRRPVAGDIVFPTFTGNQSVTPSLLWFQPLSEPTRGRRPQYPDANTLPPGVFAGASNAPSGMEWHQPLSLPQYRRKPAYSNGDPIFSQDVVAPPSTAGSCVSFCNVGLKVAYFTACDLKVAYFDDSEFCPGGQC